MGCFITIFSFLDYGVEMKAIVCKLCRAGAPFFYSHLDNEQVMQTQWSLNFPMRRHKAVVLDELEN